MRVFLDNASSTAVSQSAKRALTQSLELFGNPSSVHQDGQGTRALVEDSRDQVALALGANRSEVIFLSGGTEANNLAIKGLFWQSGKKLIVSAPTEHHAVIDPILWLESHQLAEVIWLDVDIRGQVNLEQLAELIETRGEEIALIALMIVNNETGVVTDISAVVELAKQKRIPVHADAVAAFGHLELDFSSLGLSTMAVSGHKIGAPIGVGALIASRNQKLESLQHGGSQERGLRSGTIAFPLIAAFGAAAAEISEGIVKRELRFRELRDALEQKVAAAIPQVVVTSKDSVRTGHIAHFLFPGAQSDNLLFLLDQEGISVSAGSACTAGVLAPSHVLIAMGIDHSLADCSIRVSLGPQTKESDLDAFLAALQKAYPIALQQSANQKAI